MSYYLGTNFERRRGVRHADIDVLSPLDEENAFIRESIGQWNDTNRKADDRLAERVDEFMPMMGELFEYLAERRNPNRREAEDFSGRVAARLWCLLYLVRPDLIEYEATGTAAVRYGVNKAYLVDQMKKLKRMYPHAGLRSRPTGHTGGSHKKS